MNIRFLIAPKLRLEAREIIRLYDPRGRGSSVSEWGTLDHPEQGPRDYFLAANDALTLDRPGLALIHAQARARSCSRSRRRTRAATTNRTRIGRALRAVGGRVRAAIRARVHR